MNIEHHSYPASSTRPAGVYSLMETHRPLWDIEIEDGGRDYTCFFQKHQSSKNPELTNLQSCGQVAWLTRIEVRRVALFIFDPPPLKLSDYSFEFRIGETRYFRVPLGSMDLIDGELPGGEKRKILSHRLDVEAHIPPVQTFGLYIWERLPLGTKALAMISGSYWQEVM